MPLFPFPRAVVSMVAMVAIFLGGWAVQQTPGNLGDMVRSPFTWVALMFLGIGIATELPVSRHQRWGRALVTVLDPAGDHVGYGFVVSPKRILTTRRVAEAAVGAGDLDRDTIRVRFPHVRTATGDVSVEVRLADREDDPSTGSGHRIVALDVVGVERLPRRVLPFRFASPVVNTKVLLHDPTALNGAGVWVESEIRAAGVAYVQVKTVLNEAPLEVGDCEGVPMVHARTGRLLGMCDGSVSDDDGVTLILISAAFARLNARISLPRRFARALTEIIAAVVAWLGNWVRAHAIMAVAGAVVLAVVGTVLVIRWLDGPGPTGECVVLDVTSSTEKDDLVRSLATEFETGREVDGRCVDINVLGLTSGAAMEALASDWDVEIVEPMFERSQTGRSRPGVWLPTSSMWTELLELDTKKTYETLGSTTESVMVIAVPEGTAEGEEVSMEWLKSKAVAGKTAGTGFVLGRDEPLWSTSGLGASMLTYNAAVRADAAAGASVEITPQTPEDDAVNAWVRELESSVGSYGDEATTYVQDLYCGIVEPVDALVIQKQLVDLYNSGRPSGTEPDCDQLPGYGEKSHPRVTRFESHIPPEGTLAMDHPYVVLPGLSEAQRELAEEFYEFLGEDEAQAAFVEDGFEEIGSVDEDDTFPQPEAEAIQRIRAEWDGVRKNAQVILLIDNSGSMNDEVAPGAAKIDRVQSAANAAIGLLAPKDELAVWTFGSSVHKTALAPMGDRISQVRAEIGAIEAGGRTTQLPAAVQAAHDALAQTNDPDNPKTKAVVLLTDGATNLTPDGSDAEENKAANDALVADIAGSESRVRIYTIPYGNSADKCLLEKVAAASGARYYGAGTRESLINDVMLAVFGNFGTQAAAANLPSIEAKARIPAGDCGGSAG